MLKFEQIVKTNGETNGSYQYMSYFNLVKSYSHLIAEYTIVKASVLKLAVVMDWEFIQDIRKRGYKIDLTNSETYAKSLTAALRRVSNLITKAKMKAREIEMTLQDKKGGGRPDSFEALLANLSFQVGFQIPDFITLAGYNEYCRIVKERQAQVKNSYGLNRA